jgi:hypothetical protein
MWATADVLWRWKDDGWPAFGSVPSSRLRHVTKCNQDATALHPGPVKMLSTSRHSVVVALSGATTPWVVTPMRVGVTEWEGFGPLVSRPATK